MKLKRTAPKPTPTRDVVETHTTYAAVLGSQIDGGLIARMAAGMPRAHRELLVEAIAAEIAQLQRIQAIMQEP